MMDPKPTFSPQEQNRNPLRAFSRLAIGGLTLGLDVLTGKLSAPKEPEAALGSEPIDDEQVFYDELPEMEGAAPLDIQSMEQRRSEDDLTFTLIGLIVDTSRQIGKTTHLLGRATGRIGRTLSPLISPWTNNPVARPLRNRFDRLVERGEDQVSAWKQLGQEEATQGRKLVETIAISTVDTSIDYVAQQPEVIELVTSKTRSLASVLIEYLRSIFVSVDLVLNGLFRILLRRPVPGKHEPPPMVIREGATTKYLGVEEEDIGLENTHIGYYSGIFSRISALTIDLFILGVTLTFGIWFVNISAQLLGVDLTQISFLQKDLNKILTGSFIAVAYFVAYHTLFWTLFGNTLAQALLGIRVLTNQGEPPNLIRSFLRASIGISLSIAFFIVSILMVLITKQHRALHDVLFGTVVVYTWDAHPSRRFLDKAKEKYGDRLDK